MLQCCSIQWVYEPHSGEDSVSENTQKQTSVDTAVAGLCCCGCLAVLSLAVGSSAGWIVVLLLGAIEDACGLLMCCLGCLVTRRDIMCLGAASHGLSMKNTSLSALLSRQPYHRLVTVYKPGLKCTKLTFQCAPLQVLTRAAVDRGSRDNVTVVVVDLSSSTPEADGFVGQVSSSDATTETVGSQVLCPRHC
jgi:hypothetical protein